MPTYAFISGELGPDIRQALATAWPDMQIVVDPRNGRAHFASGDLFPVVPSSHVTPGAKIVVVTPFDQRYPHFSHFCRAAELFPEAELIDPVVAAVGWPVSFPGRFACVGYQGAGNILLGTILSRIQESHGGCRTDDISSATHRLAMRHSFLLTQAMESLRDYLGANDCVIASAQSEAVTMRIAWSDGRFVSVNNVPYCGYVGQNYGAHAPPDARLRELFDRLGYTWFFAIRHPLDTIASIAAKAMRPPELAIANDRWLETRQKSVYDFLAMVAAVPERYRDGLVRYEELIAQPVDTIRRIARYLGMPVSSTTAREIWEQTGFKALTPAGEEHLYQPGKPKHHYFTRKMLSRMEETGYRELCNSLGYDWPSDADPRAEGLYADLSGKTAKATSPLYGILYSTIPRRYLSVPNVFIRSNDQAILDKAEAWLERTLDRRFFELLGPLTPPVDPAVLTGLLTRHVASA
ncbi:MAG: hypothetical protein BroJett030_06100 [Alphaproteobacteria bacterium]|nr:MAG: hypothetical protein BroJett030_06100 [Alphaproteobacteria bacterium]